MKKSTMEAEDWLHPAARRGRDCLGSLQSLSHFGLCLSGAGHWLKP
jgi:hypothetical protein